MVRWISTSPQTAGTIAYSKVTFCSPKLTFPMLRNTWHLLFCAPRVSGLCFWGQTSSCTCLWTWLSGWVYKYPSSLSLGVKSWGVCSTWKLPAVVTSLITSFISFLPCPLPLLSPHLCFLEIVFQINNCPQILILIPWVGEMKQTCTLGSPGGCPAGFWYHTHTGAYNSHSHIWRPLRLVISTVCCQWGMYAPNLP